MLLVKPAFLQKLFQYRKIFHGLASQGVNTTNVFTVISWVDIILARLGDAIVYIGSGCHEDSLLQSMPQALRRQRDEDNLYAAAQLPGMPSTPLFS